MHLLKITLLTLLMCFCHLAYGQDGQCSASLQSAHVGSTCDKLKFSAKLITPPHDYPAQWTYLMHEMPAFNSQVFVLQAGLEHAQTIMLVHGLGSNASRDWLNQVAQLARVYHVIAFDLPGFGLSGNRTEQLSPGNYGQMIEQLIQSYAKNQQVILVGHSMGGAISLHYAHRHPDQVRRLVLVDAAGILHRTVFLEHLSQFNPDLPQYPAIGGVLRKGINLVNKFRGSVLERADDLLPDPVYLLKIPQLRQTLFKDQNMLNAALSLMDENFSEAIGQTQVATEILWGDADPVAPIRTGFMLAERMPNARLSQFAGLGHVPMQEQPHLFSERLLELLARPPIPKAEALMAPPNTSQRVVECQQQDDMQFSGDYQQITLHGCARAQLLNVRAKQLVVHNSSVWMRNTQIVGSSRALSGVNASITATASLLQADTAVELDGGRLDFAGVSLKGGVQAVRVRGRAKLYFSVSDLSQNNMSRTLHEKISVKNSEYQSPF